MLQEMLMTLQFFIRLHFRQSNEPGCESKLMVAILNVYKTELYNNFSQTVM